MLVAILGLLCSCASGWQLNRAPSHRECNFFEAAHDEIRQCGGPYDYQELQLYIKVFEEVWAKQDFLPQDARKLHARLRLVDISWQPEIFGQPADGHKYLEGLTYGFEGGRQRMYCVVRKDLPASALGHELLHVGYGALGPDMKGDHLGAGNDWPDTHVEFLKKVAGRYGDLKRKADEQAESLRIQR